MRVRLALTRSITILNLFTDAINHGPTCEDKTASLLSVKKGWVHIFFAVKTFFFSFSFGHYMLIMHALFAFSALSKSQETLPAWFYRRWKKQNNLDLLLIRNGH